jgi:tryptophan-rich sensory protein
MSTLLRLVAVVGTIASLDARSFYAQLVRPTWAPPAWRFGGMALIDILLLVVSIVAIIVHFLRSGSRLAGCLLVPYLVWVSFAAVLNWALWRANPVQL